MRFTRKIEKELLFELFVFIICVAAISLLYMNNLMLSVVLLAVWGAALKFWHKKDDFVIFICGGIIGPIAEIVFVYFGVWQYANPTFLGIPVWLPLAWGFATILIVRVAGTFIEIERK